jgi:hypothetical protein
MLRTIISFFLGWAEAFRVLNPPRRVFANTLSGQGLLNVEVKTADYTIVAGVDNGKLFTNEGDAGAAVFQLPPATVGQWFEFVVKAAQEMRITPADGETIALDTGVQQAADAYITANAIGEHIGVRCVKAGEWETFDPVGTWTAV